MLGVYALRIMHVLKQIRAIKLFCSGVFWVLWGSIVLGFAYNSFNLPGFFRWGGKFGSVAAQWMVDFVHPIGTILILVAVLVIFLIVTDPRFIDRCKAFGAWIVAKLARNRPHY